MNIKNVNQLEFPSLASFNSKVSFSSVRDNITLGDNHSQRILKGINSLRLSASLNFDQLDDLEAVKLINFLQKHHYYQPQSYINNGSFSNKRVEAFDYQLFYPYKKNKFFCTSFSHQKEHRNVNNIQVTLQANSSSILNSIESSVGHNTNIDSLINSSLGGSSSVSHNNVKLKSGDFIFHSGDYANAKLTSNFNVNDGSSATLNAASNVPFPDGVISCQNTELRNSIFIHNPNDCIYYPYKPIHEKGDLNFRMFDFRPSNSISLSQSPKHRDSSVTDRYRKINKYGFNSNLMNLRVSFQGRSDLEAKRILLFLESHLGCNKFGFHALSDYGNSANPINWDNTFSAPSVKSFSTFYCPDWDHTFVYKDNHTINATFIECTN